MDLIIGVLAFIFVLGAIIIVHEGGHFLFARRANILTREFAFGMGPILFKKKKDETLYTIRAFPIGGFCAIAGEEFEDDPLKDVEQVKVEIEGNVIKRIHLDYDNEKLEHLPTLYIQNYDIYDAEETGKLYIRSLEDARIVEYLVDPQAMIQKDKEEFQIAPHNRTLGAKNKRQRAMVMFGGPLMNFLLAFLVFFIAALIGGFPNYNSTVLNNIEPNTPAYVSGLRNGDKIVHMQSGLLEADIELWNDISVFMEKYHEQYPSNKITVSYKRDNKLNTTEVMPAVFINTIGLINDYTKEGVIIGELNKKSLASEAGLEQGMTILKIDEKIIGSWKDVYNLFEENTEGLEMNIVTDKGSFKVKPYSKLVIDSQKTFGGDTIPMVKIALAISPANKFSLTKSLVYPFTQVGNAVMMVVNTFKLLFNKNSGIGVQHLSGFVGIFSLTSMVAKEGLVQILIWMGILSINVGLLNLLPIPALDGGRLVFVAYEAVTGKKPNQKVETALITITFFLLLGLIIFVTFNDIKNLF